MRRSLTRDDRRAQGAIPPADPVAIVAQLTRALAPPAAERRIRPAHSDAQRLAIPMLLDAVATATGKRFASDSARREARAWIESRLSGEVTFDWCCDVVGVDPQLAREAILRRPVNGHARRGGFQHWRMSGGGE